MNDTKYICCIIENLTYSIIKLEFMTYEQISFIYYMTPSAWWKRDNSGAWFIEAGSFICAWSDTLESIQQFISNNQKGIN